MTPVLRLVAPVSTVETDESDFERVAAGDRDAIVALYRAHHAHVRAFAQRLVGCNATAEDLVHDVFVALPSALSRFRGECPLRSFLIAIAARRAKHHVRSAIRRRAFETKLRAEPEMCEVSPDRALDRKQLAAMLTRALDELPVDQRVVFVLCEVEERSCVDVAAMLGENDATIRSRLFHARKKLREKLSRWMGDR